MINVLQNSFLTLTIITSTSLLNTFKESVTLMHENSSAPQQLHLLKGYLLPIFGSN